MDAQLDLARLRRLTTTLVTALLGAHVIIAAVLGVTLGRSWLGATLTELACLGAALAVRNRDTPSTRAICSVALIASVSVLLGMSNGLKYQVDLHMYYFAALAMLVSYCDWRPIIAAAATVAAHHLILNFLLPGLVYPGGSDFLRVLVHALILLVETAALVWTAYRLERMFLRVGEQAQQVELRRREAEAAQAEKAQIATQAEGARRAAEADVLAQERRQVVASIGDAVAALAKGDLTYSISADLPAEYARLRDDFNAAMTSLREMIATIAADAQGVRGGGADISRAADDLARRTEQQAANLQETATALAQLSETVKRTAAGAQSASAAASDARQEAAKSGEVVEQAVEAMNEIRRSSEQIGQIIGVIDEIAFQTNLLALNAGVEAARAGDAGKGFAVVASEVRALAQRSAEAAKEIKLLISSSAEQVGQGVGLVDAAGGALRSIVERAVDIDNLISNIATSAQEQASGLEQVNAAVRQMDQVTQQNAAMVEASTAAAARLQQTSVKLSDRVAAFEVGRGGAPAQPRLHAPQIPLRATARGR